MSRFASSRCRFALVVLSCSLLALAPAALPAQAGDDPVATPVQGEVSSVDGMGVLTVWGSAEEQAYAEGYLCAHQIRALMRGFALRNHLVRVPLLWDRSMVPRVKRHVTVDDAVRARLEALLRGMRDRDPAQLHLPELQRDLTVDDLIGVAALPDSLGLMCSSFARWDVPRAETSDDDGSPAATDRHRTIVGRNLDYPATEVLTRHLMLIARGPTADREAWLSIGWPGLAGCVTGVTADGVFLALHDVLDRSRRERAITPRVLALEEVLAEIALDDTSDPAAHGARILREHHYGMGGSGLLAWPGGAAVLEFDGTLTRSGGVTVRRPGEDDYIACSNHFRARVPYGGECWRYGSLFDGLTRGYPHDLDEAARLIRLASKQDTLYRLVTDLETGALFIEARRSPHADRWRRVRTNSRELLEAARAPAAPDPRGVRSGRRFW